MKGLKLIQVSKMAPYGKESLEYDWKSTHEFDRHLWNIYIYILETYFSQTSYAVYNNASMEYNSISNLHYIPDKIQMLQIFLCVHTPEDPLVRSFCPVPLK